MDDILRDLNPAQREAAGHIDGPLLILAGPGSGKTRVVTHRIANLLQSGIPAWQIAALTFTNKAAEEMRSRVETLAPGQPVWMGTFHRFCAQLLRRYSALVGLSENYSIYDTSAIEAAEVSTSHTSPEKIAAAISRAKNRLVTPDMMSDQAMNPSDKVASQVYPVYQQQLRTANAADFDDLLMHIAQLLRENPELRHDLDAKYRYILVDEYQDTNLAQYAIVRSLSIDHPNLAVTGDPDQSIYGWRGADIKNILDFEKDYPNVKTVRLEKNYRSTPNILRVADYLIRHNHRRKHKELFTDLDEGEQVVLRCFGNNYEEADLIVDEIADRVHGQGMRPQDFAIFYRMNSLSRSLEHALRSRGLPYQIVRGVEFYQRREVKDLIAYLHLINNSAHDVALSRIINVPTRGIGAKTVQKLQAFATANQMPLLEAARRASEIEGLAKRSATMVGKFVELYDRLSHKATASLEDLLRYIIEETSYDEYVTRTIADAQDDEPLANVDELITAAVEFDRCHPDDGSLELFLEQVSLVADTDDLEETSDRVTLMTLHAAKGLEFPCVYIIGVEDDLLPHARSKDRESSFEEERRLLFVGVTRAQQHLQLSYCQRRVFRGDLRPVIPSPFLTELPLDQIRQLESVGPGNWFDDDGIDQSYPDSWDLEDEQPPRQVHEKPRQSFQAAEPTTETKSGGPAALKTATDLLSTTKLPVTAFRTGLAVRHQEFGEGEIVSVSGRGPKCVARIRFGDGERSFRVAFANLELVE